MNKSNLSKLIKYMKQTFHIEELLKQLKDDRKNPKYSTAEGILPVLLGFLVRISSFNDLKSRMKHKEFQRILSRKVKTPGIDVIREVLKRVDLSGIEKLTTSIIKKAKVNKVFNEGSIDGYAVAAIDGTKLFGSNRKRCKECCTSKLKNKQKHASHHAVFMSTVGSNPRLVVDFELYKGSVDSSKKDEGELTVAKRLLDKVKHTHKHLVDVIVYDALACNSVWINHCISHKVIPVIHVKENNISSVREVKSRINKSDMKEKWNDSKRNCEVRAYEEKFQMGGVESVLRFVKLSKKYSENKYAQVLVVTSDFDISLKTLYTMMHKRWDIENSTFNKLKTYAGLEHCFVHHSNAIEAILHVMITANNMIQLFKYRRLKSNDAREKTEKAFIRVIANEMISYREKEVLNTC